MGDQDSFLASQINGGGCLAPPTPGERSNNVLGSTLNSYFGSDSRSSFEKYEGDLPKSLAWRTSSQQMSVSGMGAYIDPKSNRVPPVAEMGIIMRNGRRERIDRPRRDGDPLLWETSVQMMYRYRSAPETMKFS